jgi:hypothetical protein
LYKRYNVQTAQRSVHKESEVRQQLYFLVYSAEQRCDQSTKKESRKLFQTVILIFTKLVRNTDVRPKNKNEIQPKLASPVRWRTFNLLPQTSTYM